MIRTICLVAGMVLLLSVGHGTGGLVGDATAFQSSSDDCYTTFYAEGNLMVPTGVVRLSQSGDSRVEFTACEYREGRSGYKILRNQTNHPLSICWTLHFASGEAESACRAHLGPGEEASTSCFYCNRRGQSGGMVGVTCREITVSD